MFSKVFPNEAASPCSVVNWNDATSKQKSIGILVAIGYQDRSDPLLLRAYRNCCSSLHRLTNLSIDQLPDSCETESG